MSALLLADLLVLVHLLWVTFMVSGILLTWAGLAWPRLLRFRRWRVFHLLGLAFSAALGALGKPCPLTTLEYYLRRRAGVPILREDSFIVRLANRLIFPDLDARLLTLITLLCTASVVLIFVLKPPRRKPDGGAGPA